MTDYNALAQRIVAQGVGQQWGASASCNMGSYYSLDDYSSATSAEKFCQDGRVMLALMERVCEWGGFERICPNTTEDFLCTAYRGYGNRRNTENVVSESLAIAIVEACLDALETVACEDKDDD